MRELTERRTLFSKTFDLDDGRRRVVCGLRPKHYLDDWGVWRDIVIAPRRVGQRIVQDSCCYVASLSAEHPTLHYRSRIYGAVRVALVAADGRSLRDVPAEIVGHSVWYRDIAPGLDVEVRFDRARLEWFKYLKADYAPRRLTWEVVEETRDRSFRLGDVTVGWDSGTTVAKVPDRRRWAALTHTKHPLGNGHRGYQLEEAFTGEVRDVLDPATRRRVATRAVEYPVIIDQDITEFIVATGDDCYDKWSSGSSFTTFSNGTAYNRCDVGTQYSQTINTGLRFQTVALPAGATVDLATLKLYVQAKTDTGSGPNFSVKLLGVEDSDAAAFDGSAGNRPGDVANVTTAYAGPIAIGSVPAVGQIWSITCTSVIQEIIDDAPAWASGNDMRMALRQSGCSSYQHFVSVADYSHASQQEAELEIDYTVGGAAPGPQEFHRRPNPLLRM